MFSEKIKEICSNEGITKLKLSEILGLNYTVFRRNVKENNPTSDIIVAFAIKRPDVDLNWLLKETDKFNLASDVNGENYSISPEAKLKKAILLLTEVQTEITLK